MAAVNCACLVASPAHLYSSFPPRAPWPLTRILLAAAGVDDDAERQLEWKVTVTEAMKGAGRTAAESGGRRKGSGGSVQHGCEPIQFRILAYRILVPDDVDDSLKVIMNFLVDHSVRLEHVSELGGLHYCTQELHQCTAGLDCKGEEKIGDADGQVTQAMRKLYGPSCGVLYELQIQCQNIEAEHILECPVNKYSSHGA
ncbi:hypothetical protein ABZP36_003026 [Zizania latifolia]